MIGCKVRIQRKSEAKAKLKPSAVREVKHGS